MTIKVKTKNEAENIFNSIQIMDYEKYVDLKIEYPNGYYFIGNCRNDDNTFIPYQFRFYNNGKKIQKKSPQKGEN